MKRYTVLVLVVVVAIASALVGNPGRAGADSERLVGEKFTYTLSYGRYQNAGYAEQQQSSLLSGLFQIKKINLYLKTATKKIPLFIL